MRPAVALLAALAIAAPACGGGGAEPGAAQRAGVVLDFQPNAVHSGLYAGIEDGCFAEQGVEVELSEPSSSQDSAKLLAAGRTEFAVLDIHDLALARERGLELTAVAALVQRPLAAVIAADRSETPAPAALDGRTVGVTGLPSDEAVLDAVLTRGGGDPGGVRRVTIGFDSIAALSSGRVAAATAFWNAEGVALRDLGLPTREFRVDDFGAPPYPELVVATAERTLAERPEMVAAIGDGVACGYAAAAADPDAALDSLLAAVPELDRDVQARQLRALTAARAFGAGAAAGRIDPAAIRRWAAWDLRTGIVSEPIDVAAVLAGAGRR